MVGSVRRTGDDIAYRRLGSGPPLLLLHATLSSSRQLRALASRLAAAFTVISVDRRGSGASEEAAPSPPAPIDVAVHIEDLLAVGHAERLGPAYVVGHSYGGCLALELAARRQDSVRAVLAYEPPYGPVASSRAQEHMAAVGRRTLRTAELDGTAAAALEFMGGVSGAPSVAALTPATRERIGRSGTGAVADATLLGMQPDGLSAITAPAWVVTGTASPPVYAEIAAALCTRIPGAAHRRLHGGGHLAPVVTPDEVAAVVLECFER